MAPALKTPSRVPTMLSEVRILVPSQAPSANMSLQLSLCSFSRFVLAFDSLEAGFAASTDDVAVEDIGGVFDEPRNRRVGERDLAVKPRLKSGFVGLNQAPQFFDGSFNSAVRLRISHS